jgi:hypothetical protein
MPKENTKKCIFAEKNTANMHFFLHKAQSIRIIIHGDGIRLLYACARVREAPILERIHPSGGSVDKYRGSVGKFGASKFSYGAFFFF